MLSLSKVLIKSVDKAYKEIEHEAAVKPIDKLFHEMLRIGKKLAKTFDGLAKDYEKKEGNNGPRMDGKNPFVPEPENQGPKMDGKNPFVPESQGPRMDGKNPFVFQ